VTAVDECEVEVEVRDPEVEVYIFSSPPKKRYTHADFASRLAKGELRPRIDARQLEGVDVQTALDKRLKDGGPWSDRFKKAKEHLWSHLDRIEWIDRGSFERIDKNQSDRLRQLLDFRDLAAHESREALFAFNALLHDALALQGRAQSARTGSAGTPMKTEQMFQYNTYDKSGTALGAHFPFGASNTFFKSTTVDEEIAKGNIKDEQPWQKDANETERKREKAVEEWLANGDPTAIAWMQYAKKIGAGSNSSIWGELNDYARQQPDRAENYGSMIKNVPEEIRKLPSVQFLPGDISCYQVVRAGLAKEGLQNMGGFSKESGFAIVTSADVVHPGDKEYQRLDAEARDKAKKKTPEAWKEFNAQFLDPKKYVSLKSGVDIGELAGRAKKAIEYLDSELEKSHPVMVAVDALLADNYNTDQVTDHFVLVYRREGGTYFASDPANGKGFTLSVDDNGLLTGKGHWNYTVSFVFKNIKA
jgi:hypothetical protein